MNIAIDIDDTLTESFDYFLPFVAEYFGADVDELKKKNISYSNLPPEWKKDEIGFCRAYYDKVVASTPFKSDAAWGVQKLRDLGHRIVIITARTDELYTDPYKTTREELKNGGIVYDKLICTLDKANACMNEKISVLIDDSPENCDSVISRGIPVLLFSSKANQKKKTEYLRVGNWTDAIETLRQIERGYPDKKNAEILLAAAEELNPGPWGNHCRVAALCAQKIAEACSMDAEKAYVLALLHDIGRRFCVRDLGHIYYGHQYMQRLGFRQVAKVCLTHSFPNQDFGIYIGKIDIPENEAADACDLLGKMKYDDYDRLIQICDALAGNESFLDIEERMADVKRRYGNYPQAQWTKNVELKQYFEEKIHGSIYELLHGVTINDVDIRFREVEEK